MASGPIEQEAVLRPADDGTLFMNEYAATGDKAAFTKLVLLVGDKGINLLRHVGMHEDLIEDILQDAWMKVMSSRHLFTRGRAFQPWFNRIVVNTAYDILRKMKRRIPHLLFSQVENDNRDSMYDYNVEPRHPCAEVPLRMGIHDALGDLPPIYRDVLLNMDILGSTANETAVILDRAPATIRWRRAEGLKMMRELLADER